MNKKQYFGVRALIHSDGEIVEVWDKVYYCESAKQAAAYMRRFCDNRIRDCFDNKASYSLRLVENGSWVENGSLLWHPVKD